MGVNAQTSSPHGRESDASNGGAARAPDRPTRPVPAASSSAARPVSDLTEPVRRVVCSVRTMALVSLLAFTATLWGFTRTQRGQVWDERGRTSLGSSARAWALIVDPLAYLTLASVACALTVLVVVALLRRRVALALAAVLVVAGANITTQLFKAYWPTNPHLWSTSLPSGHSTVAMSLGIAALLVAPPGARRRLLPFVGFGATFVGACTIVGHWHRPGDVWAAYLVCLVWASAAIALVLKVQLGQRARDARYAVRPALGLAGSVVAGLVFVAVGVRPVAHDVHLVVAIVSLVVTGVLAALVLAWVSAAADDNLG